jgi:hypothetical protein
VIHGRTLKNVLIIERKLPLERTWLVLERKGYQAQRHSTSFSKGLLADPTNAETERERPRVFLIAPSPWSLLLKTLPAALS